MHEHTYVTAVQSKSILVDTVLQTASISTFFFPHNQEALQLFENSMNHSLWS